VHHLSKKGGNSLNQLSTTRDLYGFVCCRCCWC
jgi:hypothetical protein